MSRSAHFHISLAACRQVAGNEEWMTPRECWRLFGNSSRRKQECEAFAEENCSKLEAKVEGTLAPESFRIAIVFFLRLATTGFSGIPTSSAGMSRPYCPPAVTPEQTSENGGHWRKSFGYCFTVAVSSQALLPSGADHGDASFVQGTAGCSSRHELVPRSCLQIAEPFRRSCSADKVSI